MAETQAGGTEQDAQSIQAQIQAQEAQEHAHRFEVMKELETKVFEIQMDITAHPAHVHDGLPDAGSHMDGYIRGYAEPDHEHPTVVAHHDEAPAIDAHHQAELDPGHDAA